MANILGVGIVTLDIINNVDCYPVEDSEIRACDQRIALGGNCSNTLYVLTQLGYQTQLAATIADDHSAEFLRHGLAQRNISTDLLTQIKGASTPTSYVTLSRENASRSIIHHRHLPEYSAVSFAAVDCHAYDWIHFEGRNIPETKIMMQCAVHAVGKHKISLEIEKPRENIEQLIPLAHVVIFSADYVRKNNFDNPMEFLQQIHQQHPTIICIATWGAEGAVAIDQAGEHYASPSYPCDQTIDTLAAGDVFNAGIIHRLFQGDDIASTLHFSCELAGKKCAQQGLDNLTPKYPTENTCRNLS